MRQITVNDWRNFEADLRSHIKRLALHPLNFWKEGMESMIVNIER